MLLGQHLIPTPPSLFTNILQALTTGTPRQPGPGEHPSNTAKRGKRVKLEGRTAGIFQQLTKIQGLDQVACHQPIPF